MRKIFTLFAAMLLTVTAVQATEIWSGSHTTGYWNALRLIPADYPELAQISAGDVLIITMTADSANACVKLQDGNWHEFANEYVKYDAPSGAYAFTLKGNDADTIAKNGVCVTGKGYTISKVELYYHNDKFWEGLVSDNKAWTQSDELSDDLFSNFQEGDLFGVEITLINDSTWHQYTIRGRESADEQWSNIENIIFVSGINNTGIYVTKLTAAQATSLRTKHIHLAAQNLDISGLHSYKATKKATAIDEISQSQGQSQKLIRNGQLFIIRDNKTYTLQGQIVK